MILKSNIKTVFWHAGKTACREPGCEAFAVFLHEFFSILWHPSDSERTICEFEQQADVRGAMKTSELNKIQAHTSHQMNAQGNFTGYSHVTLVQEKSLISSQRIPRFVLLISWRNLAKLKLGSIASGQATRCEPSDCKCNVVTCSLKGRMRGLVSKSWWIGYKIWDIGWILVREWIGVWIWRWCWSRLWGSFPLYRLINKLFDLQGLLRPEYRHVESLLSFCDPFEFFQKPPITLLRIPYPLATLTLRHLNVQNPSHER